MIKKFISFLCILIFIFIIGNNAIFAHENKQALILEKENWGQFSNIKI